MDNKVTPKRINDHLEYDWYKYLIILIAIVVVFYFVFSQINRTRDYEDVAIFVSCYASDANRFEERVKTQMGTQSYKEASASKYGDDVLREISIETQDPLSSTYGTMLQTHGMVSSDILIVSKSVLGGYGNGFVQLTDELLEDYLLPDVADEEAEGGRRKMRIDELEYYERELLTGEKIRVGIKVSSFTNPKLPFSWDWTRVEDYKKAYEDKEESEQPDKEFYLVINPDSVSIGRFGKKAKDKNAQALYCVNRFIAYYNNGL